MKNARYRLADSTIVEPLVNQWSAWTQLMSPVPASLHLANFQLLALRSYLEDPPAHIRASRDPDLIGGPFVDVTPERVDEIRELLETTELKQAHNLKLAQSLTSFQNWLVDEAKGQSLEGFYRRIPEELGGFVELTYDYFNHPMVRCFENLLYESRYYDTSLQSLRLCTLVDDGPRKFFMSTPRLLHEGQIDWQIAFDDERVDELFRLDVEPQPLDYIQELLHPSETNLAQFLTDADSRRWEPSTDDLVHIRYFGHACILIEWKGTTILTDPFIPALPVQGGMSRYSYQDLPAKIDFALVTHNHQDHFALESLLRLRHRIEHLVVPRNSGLLHGDVSLKLMTRKLGFPRVVEMDALESIALLDGEIVAIPFLGEHGDLALSKSAYVVRAGNEQILIGADSDCLDRQLYVNLRNWLGPIETVFIGTESVGAPLSWGSGPLFPRKPQHLHEQTRRYHGSNAERALEILKTVGAKRVYNYAMGLEPWVEHLLGLGLTSDAPQYQESEKLIAAWRGMGGTAERLCGRDDLVLTHESRPARIFVPATFEDSKDAEDQFVF